MDGNHVPTERADVDSTGITQVGRHRAFSRGFNLLIDAHSAHENMLIARNRGDRNQLPSFKGSASRALFKRG